MYNINDQQIKQYAAAGNLKIRLYAVAGLNIVFSFLYFKQLIYPGPEAVLLDLKGILLTPFVFFYNFIGILILLTVNNKRGHSSKLSGGGKWSYVLLAFILLSMLAFPLTFLNVKAGYHVATPLVLAILDPLKAAFLFRENLKQIFFRVMMLLMISFLLIFISSVLGSFCTNQENAWRAWFGGLYFLILTFVDFWLAHCFKARAATHKPAIAPDI